MTFVGGDSDTILLYIKELFTVLGGGEMLFRQNQGL